MRYVRLVAVGEQHVLPGPGQARWWTNAALDRRAAAA